MYKDSKIYVAGHTGLLGSALLEKLKERGYQRIITRTHSELDLTDRTAVLNFFHAESPDYVFLCAAKVGGIISNKTYPADYLHINIAIQDNIFEMAQKFEVKHLLFYGSSCVYPRLCAQPIKEEYLLTGPMEETSEGYATAKIAGLIACKVYNQQYQTNRFIALVPSTIYGPNDNFDSVNSHVLSALIRKFHEAKIKDEQNVTLWGDGTPRREFIFSKDMAEASLVAMERGDALENGHYNVGSGSDFSIKELSEMVAEAIGYEGAIKWDTTKPNGTPRKLLDTSRFSSLGWTPITGLETGLRETYEWYMANCSSKYLAVKC